MTWFVHAFIVGSVAFCEVGATSAIAQSSSTLGNIFAESQGAFWNLVRGPSDYKFSPGDS